jgi:hypothetical protein
MPSFDESTSIKVSSDVLVFDSIVIPTLYIESYSDGSNRQDNGEPKRYKDVTVPLQKVDAETTVESWVSEQFTSMDEESIIIYG